MGESRRPIASAPDRCLVGIRLLIAACLFAVCSAAAPAAAAPGLGRPGYTLSKVSAAVPATGIAQLAFRPGDTAHVYASRTSGVVTRYDYNFISGPSTGPETGRRAPCTSARSSSTARPRSMAS